MLYQAVPGSNLVALLVHVLDDVVPLTETLSRVVQLEAGDGDLPGDDGVDDGPAVPHHEDPLGAGEESGEVVAVFQSKWILHCKAEERF